MMQNDPAKSWTCSSIYNDEFVYMFLFCVILGMKVVQLHNLVRNDVTSIKNRTIFCQVDEPSKWMLARIQHNKIRVNKNMYNNTVEFTKSCTNSWLLLEMKVIVSMPNTNVNFVNTDTNWLKRTNVKSMALESVLLYNVVHSLMNLNETSYTIRLWINFKRDCV